MPKKSSLAIFLAATSAIAISSAENTTLKASENDLGGIKELLRDQEGCFLLPSDPLSWKNLFLSILNKKIILSKFKPPQIRSFYDVESDFDKFILKNIKKKILR